MNPLLIRYWFKTKRGLGFGVTGHSVEDAQVLLAAQWPKSRENEVVGVVENVDVSTLDQGHVIPNMGAPSVRGVWFPRSNG